MKLNTLTPSHPFHPYSGRFPSHLLDKELEADMFYLRPDCSLSVLMLVLNDHRQRMADKIQRHAWIYGETP